MSFSISLNRAIPDFTIKGGRLVLSRGAECTRDRLYLGLSMNNKDWFLDIDEGLPWYPDETEPAKNSILGGTMSDAEVGARIRRRILQDSEVRTINSLTVARIGNRATNVTVEAKTVHGDTFTVDI